MKKEFTVNRQGKDYVVYAGLLDQAHQEGLKRISTQLLQVPSEENGRVAICLAEVETSKGTFTGIGDASPDNVGRMIAMHTIRMAETRAKARALRDAIDVGVTALEELGDAGEDDAPPARQQPRTQAPTPIRQTNRVTGEVTEAASDAQMKAIAARVARLNGIYEMDIEEPGPGILTVEQATQRIRELDDLGRAAKAEHAHAAQPAAAGK